jgi:hypothetical protein
MRMIICGIVLLAAAFIGIQDAPKKPQTVPESLQAPILKAVNHQQGLIIEFNQYQDKCQGAALTHIQEVQGQLQSSGKAIQDAVKEALKQMGLDPEKYQIKDLDKFEVVEIPPQQTKQPAAEKKKEEPKK